MRQALPYFCMMAPASTLVRGIGSRHIHGVRKGGNALQDERDHWKLCDVIYFVSNINAILRLPGGVGSVRSAWIMRAIFVRGVNFWHELAIINDPKAYFDDMRGRCPVHCEPHHGTFMGTSYNGVMEVLNRKDDVFSSAVSMPVWGYRLAASSRALPSSACWRGQVGSICLKNITDRPQRGTSVSSPPTVSDALPISTLPLHRSESRVVRHCRLDLPDFTRHAIAGRSLGQTDSRDNDAHFDQSQNGARRLSGLALHS